MPRPTIFYVMGVSGCGKSTIGNLLAQQLKYSFFDADDYHPKANVKKMAAGNPLDDQDRVGWLKILNDLAIKHKNEGAVIACSALKEMYRNTLSDSIEKHTMFVYLEGTFDQILERLQARKGHFMPLHLLQSQFETLEPPKNAIHVPISDTPEEIVSEVLRICTT